MSSIEVAKEYIHSVQTGNQAGLAKLISPTVVWHQPGKNRFSGTHQGLPAVANLIGQMMGVSGGTFAITRATRYMANGDWVAIELEFAAQRSGAKLAQSGIDLLRIDQGQIVEVRLFSSDQDAEDVFWGT